MPNDRPHDFTLEPVGGTPRGFMLARGRNRGRAWRRSSIASVPGHGSPSETRFSTTPPEIAFAETFDDFSGGDGFAYRDVAPPNGVHWSENFDLRHPGQAVHCQALKIAVGSGVPPNSPPGVVRLGDFPTNTNPVDAVGKGAVVALSSEASFDLTAFEPTGLATEASALFCGIAVEHRPFEGRPASFGSFHYFGVGSGNFVQGNRDLTVITESGLPGTGFVNAGSRLWRYHGARNRAHYVQSVAAEASVFAAASWSATLSVGNGANGIKDMIGYRENVFCGLADGLYQLDQSGTAINVTGELAGRAHPDNFRDLDIHEGEVVGAHVSAIYAYNPFITDSARVRQISPAQRSARSPVVGQHRAVRSFGGWLYAGLWTGSASYLRAGREAAPGDWRWHTLNRLPHTSKVSRIHFDGISLNVGATQNIPNRIWVATDASFGYGGLSGTAPLYYAPVPRDHHNPLAADPVFSANYNGSARMDLPAINRGAPGVRKIGRALEVWADGFLSGSRYADVYYTADRGARTLLGRVQSSPVSTLLMGSTNGSFVGFRELELSLESFNTTPGTCQVYRSVVLRGNLRPEYVETIDALVAIGDDLPDRRGTPMRPASVVIDDLRELADTRRLGGAVHKLIDLSGAVSHVVMVGMPEESESYSEGQENPEVLAAVRMAVLSLTASV